MLVHPAVAGAQSIGGSIREADGGPLIAGGFVTLLDETGEAVQADFTSVSGTFSLTAPGPGQFRVRVERIGYEGWTSESYTLAAGERQTIQIEIPPEPVLLADLRVEVVRSCLDDPSQGAELAKVWEEARKALATAIWAERKGQITFTLTEYDRTLEPGSLAIREAQSRVRTRVRLPPFESIPVSELTESGYAIIDVDTATYYAPDATVLLSQEFQDTHCFGLRRARLGETPVLGVTFTPRGSRSVVEIEGTLWIDEATAELRRVQLVYRNVPLPRGTDRRLVGADLSFARLPNGPFYVREWWIRFPIVGHVKRVGTAVSADRIRTVLAGYKQIGGSITNAFVGDRPVEAGGGAVSGVVHDSASGGPLAGADIVLRDWIDAAQFLPDPEPGTEPFSGVTDSGGAFVLTNVPDGVYAIRVDHPRLRAAGLRLTEHQVRVEDGRSEPLDLATPGGETIYAWVCPGSRLDKARGAIVGFARDAATQVGVAGVSVSGRWRVRRITVTSTGDPLLSNLSEGVSAVSDADGRFVLCDVPTGEAVCLRVEGQGDGASVTQDVRVVWQDVLVDP